MSDNTKLTIYWLLFLVGIVTLALLNGCATGYPSIDAPQYERVG